MPASERLGNRCCSAAVVLGRCNARRCWSRSIAISVRTGVYSEDSHNSRMPTRSILFSRGPRGPCDYETIPRKRKKKNSDKEQCRRRTRKMKNKKDCGYKRQKEIEGNPSFTRSLIVSGYVPGLGITDFFVCICLSA